MVRTSFLASLAFPFALLALAAQTAAASTESILWNFKANGGSPQGPLIIHGTSLYGTATGENGTTGYGQVFKLHDSSGTWKLTSATRFDGTNGATPVAGVIADSSGALYGTTSSGDAYGGGNVFKVWYRGGVWNFQSLWAFGGSGDGANPSSHLIMDGSGNLYGTTENGGAYGFGTAFELSQNSGKWSETVLVSFPYGSYGADPYGGLMMDRSGNLYGTTKLGGADFACPYDGSYTGCGIVFELAQSGGVWKEHILYNFSGVADGYFPTGELIGAKGTLYGTTGEGGRTGGCAGLGCGTVFALSRSGGTWTEKILYTFMGGTDGAYPYPGLRLNSNGALFGTAYTNGYYGYGTLFSLNQSGGVWTFNLLHSFGYPSGDGEGPAGSVVIDKAGNVYGTTSGGGTYGYGAVWELTP